MFKIKAALINGIIIFAASIIIMSFFLGLDYEEVIIYCGILGGLSAVTTFLHTIYH